MSNTKKSLIAILICYFSWGLFPIYFKLLKSIDAYEVLSLRVLCSFIFMVLVVLIAANKKFIFNEIKEVWKDKKSFVLLIAASLLITANWLTYIIAVNTNHVLEASFGYYLNPIVTIILAVVFLKEKLTRVQTIACLFVGASLLYLFISLGSLPWISILLALTFGLYSLCKKKIVLSPKASLLVETAIVSPIALIYMWYLWNIYINICIIIRCSNRCTSYAFRKRSYRYSTLFTRNTSVSTTYNAIFYRYFCILRTT